MADQIETPVPNPIEDGGDATTAFLVKMLASIIAGPKIGALLQNIGITVDPTLLAVMLGGILHKAHILIKQETGWTWL